MPGDYSSKLLAAKAKLEAKGMPMVYVRRTEDPTQLPTPGGGTPVLVERFDFYGVRLKPSYEEVQMGIFGAGDDLVLAPGDCCEGHEPDTTDRIEIDGVAWDIRSFTAVRPTDVAIIYKFSVKRRV